PSKLHLRFAPGPPLLRWPRFLPALHPSASYPWAALPEPPQSHPRCSPPPYRSLPMPPVPGSPAPAGQPYPNPDSRSYKSPARPHPLHLLCFSSLSETISGSSSLNLPREASYGLISIPLPPPSPFLTAPA